MVKTISRYLLALPAAFSASTVLAQSTLNDQEIPYGFPNQDITSFFAWGSGLVLFFWLFGLAATVFWVMMIVHAASKKVEGKAAWIILMIFTHFLGALIYYFVVKRSFKK